ncbi:LPXTG cell wall anchor domain-containing protein [Vagococcus carniphilus]|uniref:LPXTG cell wall anchor domain-containing protein n=1 Tax=Vagococcus carniphilus TaxID=218144 RepID=UPI003BA9F58B
MNYLKKGIVVSLFLVLSLSFVAPISSFAAEDAKSDVTISFSEKTLKGKPDPQPTKPVDPTKPVTPSPSKPNGNDGGKVFASILPKTGEVLTHPLTYIGLALMIGALSYKIYRKRRVS